MKLNLAYISIVKYNYIFINILTKLKPLVSGNFPT